MLERHDLRGLFFITGHVAEKLRGFPPILEMLETHEIGYHSSSHSVRPTIFEFTDIGDYGEAYQISHERETAHINPLTGQTEGKGGIHSIRDLFPAKKIDAFRAPGLCWSPPHLEALRDLGIRFDFSANISSTPVSHKGITFYPYPLVTQWYGSLTEYTSLMSSILRNELTVLCLHPNLFVSQQMWDSIYWKDNPKYLTQPLLKSFEKIPTSFFKFRLLLKKIKLFERVGLVNVRSRLMEAKTKLTVKPIDVQNCYETSMQWPIRYFNYKPKFLRYHFIKFFYQKRAD